MLQRKIAANRTYSADSAGRRSETDTEKPLQCSEIICCLSNIKFLRAVKVIRCVVTVIQSIGTGIRHDF